MQTAVRTPGHTRGHDSVVLPAEARSAVRAVCWLIAKLSGLGLDSAEAEGLAARVGRAWSVAGSALYGRRREGHHLMVSIRADGPRGLAIDLIGDITVSRRLAAQLAAELAMEAVPCDGIDGTFRLTLHAADHPPGPRARGGQPLSAAQSFCGV